MRLYKILLQYFLFISFCYCHDLNHADPGTIKQSESVVTADPLSKIETTNVQKNENENIRFRATNDFKKSIPDTNQVNEQQIPSQNRVPVDVTSPFTPVQVLTEQQIMPPISDTIKNIPISNDNSVQTQINPNPVEIIQQNQLKEDPSFAHTESHIAMPLNSNPNDLKSDQDSQIPFKTTSEPSIVQNESHPPRIVRASTPRYHQQTPSHPRNVQINQQQTEDNSLLDGNQSENATIETTQPSINNTDISNSKSNLSSTKQDSNKSQIENATPVPSSSVHDTNAHLPRVFGNETNDDDNTNETNQYSTPIESKIEEENKSISILSNSHDKIHEICWHLPKKFEPSIELLENQIFHFVNILPEFLQTIFFARINDREILMNTIWFCSICTMCFLFSFLFLSMGTKRLKQTKYEKEVRARCQQLQQYNNQIELERSTFERQNQKLSDEIVELKSLSIRDNDDDVFVLRTECNRFQQDVQTVRHERDILQEDIDQKQNLILKYQYDLKGQVEIVTHLNNQVMQLQQELDKEREIVNRLKSNDLSLERFEKTQEIIQELKSEIIELKHEKLSQKTQVKEIEEHANQLDIENHQLILKIKQLKDLFEQRNQTIKNIYEKIQTIENFESEDLLSIITENSDFLLSIDNDIQKSNQHIHDLHFQINQKTSRIKELENLFKQEKDHSKEIETKLKIVLELRERDAHLHIRQLGQTDAELRRARTDTERVRILQQQLELKQQQLDDIQKVLSNEQMKFNEDCSKLQHETHEKWMEVKRLTRELDTSKKECEGLRRQITKYANNERTSQEKAMNKSASHHFGESERNGSSPNPYQQGEFRPINQQHNDSGAISPSEMLMPRPPIFGLSRPPFFPQAFLQPPPPNPFIMHPRFPIPSPHGMMSPISHLISNGNDLINSEIIDSSNYDTQSNEAIASPVPDIEKPKKAKKSLKKKSRTSVIKEDV